MTKQITFIILTFLLFSCKGKNGNEYQSVDINSQLLEVSNYQERNDFQNANNLLESLIEKNPNNAELFFRLAHSRTI
jgi:hypothetical protein